MHTIDQVIARLDQITAICEKQQSRQAYFAWLYAQMTRAVKEGIESGAFADGPRMEKLDVLFALRYIRAWEQFNTRQPCSTSWQVAFLATAQDQHIVLQHLLAGINAHINLDLAMAAAETAPGEAIFSLQSDFEKINQLIQNLSDDVQHKLEHLWWPMKWLSQVAKGKEKVVLDFSIGKAREASWANAVALAMATPEMQKAHLAIMDEATTLLARKIFQPGAITSGLIRSIRWMEPQDLALVMQKLRA